MEALGSLYVDRYGLDVVCLRIGSALPEPRTPRHLSTWLSPADTVGLVHAALTAPAPGFAVVWGVSANTRGWWDLTSARALGYDPVDDAETHAAAITAAHGEPTPGTVEFDRVGGEYAGPDFAVDAVAARAAAAVTGPDRAAVEEWIADDPHPGDAAELQALLDAGDDAELAARFAGPLTFGTAGLRGPLRAGSGRDERRRGRPRRRRPGPVPAASRAGPGSRRGRRLRRPAPLRRVRPGHRRGADRRRVRRLGAAAPAAHPGAVLRRPAPGRRRRGDGHRQPQPAAGQRLQGLPGRRRPAGAPGRPGDRGRHRRRRPGAGAAARRRTGRPSATTSRPTTSPPSSPPCGPSRCPAGAT